MTVDESLSNDDQEKVKPEEIQAEPILDQIDEKPSEEDADASMLEGFESVHGEKEDAGAPSEELDPPAATDEPVITDNPEPDANPDESPGIDPQEIKSLQKRLRKAERRNGDFKNQFSDMKKLIDDIKAAPAGDEPAASPEYVAKLEKAVSEFETLKPVKEGFESFDSRMAEIEKVVKSIGQPESGQNRNEIIEQVTLNVKHPGWEKTTASPEFLAHVIEGGPSAEEYSKYAQLLNSNDATKINQANEIVNDWEDDHPGWWNDRGNLLFSDDVNDSIAMLDKYEVAITASEKQELLNQQETTRKKNRLEKSLTPSGVDAGGAPPEIDAEVSFSQGFKNVNKANSL